MPHIAVLDYQQAETEQPRRFVGRSAGQNLVRRALAYWIVKNAVLRMISPDEIRRLSERLAIPPAKYPPVEVPNTKFEDPRNKGKSAPQTFWKWAWND